MAVLVRQVDNPTMSFDMAGSGVSQIADYAMMTANMVSNGYNKLASAMTGVSDNFMNRLTASTDYYSNLSVLEESVELSSYTDDSIFVTVYDSENYMDMPYEVQELMMHDPYLREEYEQGEINGYGYKYNGSKEYDNTVNELLYSGVSDGDVAHDIVLGENKYYTERERDSIEQTRLNLILALEDDGDDLTDID